MIFTIKPIETLYRGYRFRSRLEARWAVYFDAMDWQWEYEREGYDLGVLGWYLPDFWLPQFRSWAEVKPEVFTDVELGKARRLCSLTGHYVALLDGPPDERHYCSLVSDDLFGCSGCGDRTHMVEILLGDERIGPHPRRTSEERTFPVSSNGLVWYDPCTDTEEYRPWVYPEGRDEHISRSIGVPSIQRAVYAARSARFEHGETGMIQ